MATLIETLASYIPALITRRLVADPTPITEPTTERFSTAVLFADISGFTPLTERLSQRGADGVEELSRVLNNYFGQLIDLITAHGGDIVKFAGDAALTIWPAEDGDMASAVLRAAQCGLAIQDMLHNYEIAEGETLSLKVAVGAGDVTAVYVGGEFQRWEFILVGSPFAQVGRAEKHSRPGDVVLSPKAWSLVRDRCQGTVLPSTDVHLHAVRDGLFPRPLDAPPLPDETETALVSNLWAYVPAAIRARLKAGQTGWMAELRRITVLFINLPDVDFDTSLAQAQTLMRTLQMALYRYEGSVNKINVDDKGVTLVAAMGLPPMAHEDDTARGVKVALAMQAALRKIDVRSAIGITTGRAFCGSIGNDQRREYALHGVMVNMSARLMQAAVKDLPSSGKKPCPILCDAATYQAAREQVTFETLPPITVKGKADPVAVYRPLGEILYFQASSQQAKTQLVGRLAERGLLKGQLEALLDGVSGVVMIEGEAGIGKSRLVEDLLHQAQALFAPVEMDEGERSIILMGVGDAVEKFSPYHAWRAIFAQLLDLDGDDAARQRAQVQAQMEKVTPDLLHLAPLLNAVLPMDLPDNDLTAQMSGDARADNTRELLVRLLQATVGDRPLLLILEDAHWLDSASWALARRVNRDVQPLLLVIATRPLRVPSGGQLPEAYVYLRDAPGTEFMRLGALSATEIETLICQRLEVVQAPGPVVDFVREKAENHPFFTEELVYALRDAGQIKVVGGECRMASTADDLRALDFPNTIQGVITSRIDRLAPRQQLTLKVASVIGRIFSVRVLREIHPIEADKPHLHDYLDTLVQLNLTLLDVPEPDLAYSFKHLITREVAYNLMSFSQRRRLHRAIAEWYEHTFADDLAPFYPSLTHHWHKAQELPKAMGYLEQAGEQALHSGAYQEAVRLLERLLILAQEQGDRVERDIAPGLRSSYRLRRARWERLLGDAYWRIGNLPESLSHARQTLEILGVAEPTTSAGLWASLLKQVSIQVLHRLWPKRFIERGQDDGGMLEAARACQQIGQIYYFNTESVLRAFNVMICSLNFAEAAGSASPMLAIGYASLGISVGTLALHPLAQSYGRQARQVAEMIDAPAAMAYVLLRACMYDTGVGRWDKIQDAYEAIEIADRLGDWRIMGDVLTNLGLTAYYQGDIASVGEIGADLYALAARHDNFQQQPWGLNLQGTYHLQMGHTNRAIICLQTAWQMLASSTDRITKIINRGILAVAHLRQGDHLLARQVVDTGVRLIGHTRPITSTTFDGYVAVPLVYLALWEASRDPSLAPRSTVDRSATELAEQAKKACKTLHRYARVFPIGRPRAWLYQGWHDWLSGKARKARRAWRKSLAEAERLAMPYEEGLAHYEIGRHLPAGDAARQEHLGRAVEIFTRLRTAYDLAQANEALESAAQ